MLESEIIDDLCLNPAGSPLALLLTRDHMISVITSDSKLNLQPAFYALKSVMYIVMALDPGVRNLCKLASTRRSFKNSQLI